MSTEPDPPHRKRLRRREIPGDIRFITFSCYQRLPLLGNPAIRDHFVQTMVAARHKHGFELFAWVVMPEHAHILVRPRHDSRLDVALRSMKTSMAKQVVARWRKLSAPILPKIRTPRGTFQFWLPGGGFDRNVRGLEAFCREVKYTRLNPVERELVELPEDWKWSSVRWWMGQREGEVECDPPPGDPRSWERWLGYM